MLAFIRGGLNESVTWRILAIVLFFSFLFFTKLTILNGGRMLDLD